MRDLPRHRPWHEISKLLPTRPKHPHSLIVHEDPADFFVPRAGKRPLHITSVAASKYPILDRNIVRGDVGIGFVVVRADPREGHIDVISGKIKRETRISKNESPWLFNQSGSLNRPIIAPVQIAGPETGFEPDSTPTDAPFQSCQPTLSNSHRLTVKKLYSIQPPSVW